MNDEALRYPTGKFAAQNSYTKDELDRCIKRIESFPARLDTALRAMDARP